jgi:CBS domain-containing protein
MILVSMILKEKGSEVISVTKDSTVIEALQLMAGRNIGAVLVMENSKPLGIFSERDFARHVARDQNLMLKMPVETCMTRDLYYVTPSSTVDECMALMTQKHIRHFPVLEGNDLVGLISIGDVVKNMIEDKNLLIDNLEKYLFG